MYGRFAGMVIPRETRQDGSIFVMYRSLKFVKAKRPGCGPAVVGEGGSENAGQ